MSSTTFGSFGFNTGLTKEVWDFGDLVLKSRMARALEDGVSRYPFHRSLRYAARMDLQQLFDSLACIPGWRAHGLDSSKLILDGEGVFVSVHGGRKADYCSCFFAVWAETVERAEAACRAVIDCVGSTRILDPMFSIDWHFLTAKGELQSAAIEELADDVLYDEAYPELSDGVDAFIKRYLDAKETVLVLQGPPGTGKTRLIRAILGEMSRRNGGQAQALYTGDKRALENDEIFVKFITGWDDAFVVEDADHLLKPRAEGNEHLHRFLAIADGVVRAQGRKIIFSTNLPNVGDLDDALVRPGRCYARVHTRDLTPGEAKELMAKLTRTGARGMGAGQRGYSLAEVYRSAGQIIT